MFRKGFTLIELLVVIAVMAVLAAAVLIAINPADKIKAGQDSKVQADVAQVSSAMNAYLTSNNGVYPAGWTSWTAIVTGLQGAGELSTATIYDPDGVVAGGIYTYGGTATSANSTAVVYGNLLSRKYTTTASSGAKCVSNQPAYWFWSSASGQACGVCNTAPTVTSTCTWFP